MESPQLPPCADCQPAWTLLGRIGMARMGNDICRQRFTGERGRQHWREFYDNQPQEVVFLLGRRRAYPDAETFAESMDGAMTAAYDRQESYIADIQRRAQVVMAICPLERMMGKNPILMEESECASGEQIAALQEETDGWSM